ncbi:hypothetical protein Tco_0140920 [Tanacetum coccineum]
MSSSSSHATVTYTSMSSHSPPWVFHLLSRSDSEAPEAAPQSPNQAPLSPSYAPVYPEYVVPSDDDLPAEDQPLAASASPTALSLDYLTDSEPVEDDPEEDPEEDLVDYPSKEEEEEPLAPDLSASLVPDSVPSSQETERFEEGEIAATTKEPPGQVRRLLPALNVGSKGTTRRIAQN